MGLETGQLLPEVAMGAERLEEIGGYWRRGLI
jgi:hypothetical protein